MHLDEQEQKVRLVLAKMESGFMHRLVDGTTSILTQGALLITYNAQPPIERRQSPEYPWGAEKCD